MKRDGAWVVTIGDELLRGEIVDSNKSFLSERLLALDLETARHVTVADDEGEITEVLRQAVSRARVVLVSGGLGPTRDDITTEVVARAFGRTLVRDPEVLERIRAYFAAVGREMSENNAKQADFPDGAEVLPNPRGTAPGFALEAEGALVFCMPGVPGELYRMVDHEVLPRLEARLDRDGVVRATLLRTFGLGESILDRELGDLARDDPSVKLGFRTQFPDNLVRVLARGPTEEAARSRLDAVAGEIRRRLGPLVVCEAERTLEQVVAGLLLEQKRTLALAESCTGGLVAHLLTEVPGSSGFLAEALVTYSNDAKMRSLGVAAADLEAHGAVSEAVALEMALGARERAATDLALAVTGIAGPEGGTPDKPVGTVWIALARSDDGTITATARCYHLLRDRSRNKRLAAHIALDWLRRALLGVELPDETFPRLRGLARREAS